MLSNRGLGTKAKKCLYERVIVPTALYGADELDMRSAERMKVSVLEMKCLRIFWLECHEWIELGMSPGGERELDQRVLRLFGHNE